MFEITKAFFSFAPFNDKTPGECCDCLFSDALYENDALRRPNPADPGEGYYRCRLLNLSEVWGECPKCEESDWKRAVTEELKNFGIIENLDELTLLTLIEALEEAYLVKCASCTTKKLMAELEFRRCMLINFLKNIHLYKDDMPYGDMINCAIAFYTNKYGKETIARMEKIGVFIWETSIFMVEGRKFGLDGAAKFLQNKTIEASQEFISAWDKEAERK